MIAPERFVGHLSDRGSDFFVGVPDSLLKQFSSYLMASHPKGQHIITANEGAAIAVAVGHHLATGRVPVVYMQNSGIGNAVNPLLSLADADVYGIPMLVVIGWRGQPGVKDEPQHVKQGRVMTQLLDAMELPFVVLPHEEGEAFSAIDRLLDAALARSSPAVVLVEANTFDIPEIGVKPVALEDGLPSREAALEVLAVEVPKNVTVVSTTGMLSRELFELRVRAGVSGDSDFLTVGGMGHASSIAMGLALAADEKETWCFDGDGALLMHAGTLAVIAHAAPRNFFHVVFNNGVHDSVGGQPTAITAVDIPALALASGYAFAESARSLADIGAAVERMRNTGGPALLELRVKPGARKDLGRPTRTPRESKERFMAALHRQLK